MHLWLVCYQLATVLEISYDLTFPTYKNTYIRIHTSIMYLSLQLFYFMIYYTKLISSIAFCSERSSRFTHRW